jgi:hypothetical protein
VVEITEEKPELPEPELDLEPPEPDFELKSRNGWIDREGKYYPCDYSGHIDLAMRLNDGEHKLELLGWIKVSDALDPRSWEHNRQSIIVGDKEPNQAQINTIYALCEKHGYKYKLEEWVE